MAGHLHLQLRHYASALVVDSNICYGRMLLSRDTVKISGRTIIGLSYWKCECAVE